MTPHDHGPGPPSSRAAIASPAGREATSSPSPCQTGVRPILTTRSHPSENHDERFSAAFTLARRDGLSRFRTCLRAPVGSTEAAKDVVARFGRIDRGSREATSPLGAFLHVRHPRPGNGSAPVIPHRNGCHPRPGNGSPDLFGEHRCRQRRRRRPRFAPA